MKREDLKLILKKQHQQNSGKNTLIFTSIYILGMLMFTPFMQIIKENELYALIWFPAFFGYLIIFPLVWMRAKGIKPIKIKCQSCEAKLNALQIQIVMASKNCPICGKGIIEDENEEKD